MNIEVDCGLLSQMLLQTVGKCSICRLGTLLNFVGLRTLLIFTCLHQSPWHHTVVGTSFIKDTLLSACDEYMRSNDCGNDKTWSMLITQISQEIAAIVHEKNERVLEELEKVISLTILHFIDNNRFCRVSTHGSVTMHLDIPKRSQKSQRRIVVPSYIWQDMECQVCVYLYLCGAHLWQSKRLPTVEKKILESLVLHCRIFLRNSVSGAKTMRRPCSGVEFQGLARWGSAQVDNPYPLFWYDADAYIDYQELFWQRWPTSSSLWIIDRSRVHCVHCLYQWGRWTDICKVRI